MNKLNGEHCVMWVTCVLVILFCGIRCVSADDYCQQRQDPIPTGRQCQKPCLVDQDCRSKKKSCLCDGVCGLSCIKHSLQCPQLDSLANGRVDVRNNNMFGSVATYSCNDGYELRGNKARVCQGDGTWSHSAPWCILDPSGTGSTIVVMGCMGAPRVPNSKHDGDTSTGIYNIGTMLQYECLQHFQPSPDAVKRAWCVRDGEWIGPNMTCTVVSCHRLDDIDNGWVSQESVNTIGTIARYHCQSGFFLAGRFERLCEDGGVWTGTPPSCEKVTCTRPPVVENAHHDSDPDQEKFPSGHQIVYMCIYGYYPAGEPHVMCSGDGDWVGLTLTCSPRSCGFPGEIINGRRAGYAFTYPNTVKYYCNDGYILNGEAVRKCQDDGTWSNHVPWCEAVTCPTLYSPVLGRMYGAGNTYGTVIRFECDNRYTLIGSPERRCQADRTWSGQNTKCEVIDCGWPFPFYNGFLIGNDTTVGASIFYSCKTRSNFEGSAFQATCMENAKWSSPPPKCWGQCQVPNIPNAMLVKGRVLEFVNHNTTVAYRCKGGLVPRDGPSMRCNNGTWTHKIECGPAPCPDYPPHVHNGMRVFLGREHGFRAKYICFSGYKLVGMDTRYLTCNFGRWEPEHVRPHCEEFYCLNPGTIEDGIIFKKVQEKRFHFKPYIRRIRHGDRLEYDCNKNYRLVGPSGATCVDGQWQPPLRSTCKPIVHPPFRNLWKPIPNLRH